MRERADNGEAGKGAARAVLRAPHFKSTNTAAHPVAIKSVNKQGAQMLAAGINIILYGKNNSVC